jgi:hypothetical protein
VNQVSTKRAFPVARIREAWSSKHRKAAQLGVEPVGNVEHRNVEFANLGLSEALDEVIDDRKLGR